ncbi:hypothetical protein AAC387_Pa03g2418 [Persea americana]
MCKGCLTLQGSSENVLNRKHENLKKDERRRQLDDNSIRIKQTERHARFPSHLNLNTQQEEIAAFLFFYEKAEDSHCILSVIWTGKRSQPCKTML